MLKLVFGCLVAANAGLYAYQQGYLETLLPEGREPGRAASQLYADKIKLLPAAPVAAEEPVVLEPAAAKVNDILACTEIGNFDTADAKRFETRLADWSLGDRLSRRNVREVARHMVYIPSQGDKDGAEKKSSELRRLGIKDFYVIQDNTELQWGISLGIFKSEEAARTHLATLSQKGVRTARLGVHQVTTNKVLFQMRALDADTKGKLDKIKTDFPNQEVRSCEAGQT